MRSLISAIGYLALVGGCALLVGCSKPATEPIPPPVVTVAKPLVQDVTEYEEFTGTIAPVEAVEVKARVFGYLQSIKFKEGDYVQQGDLLFVIDPSTYEAEVAQSKAQVRLAEAQVAYSQADYKRIAALRPTGAVSQEDLDRSLQAKDVATAQLASSQADLKRRQLDLDFCRIYAPISGRISRTQFTLGNLIQGGQASSSLLTTIVSVNPMYAYFDVDEQTMLRIQKKIREGQFRSVRDQTRDTIIAASTATVLLAGGSGGAWSTLAPYVERTSVPLPVTMKLANETAFEHRGVVDFVNNVVTASTGTITVRAVFDNGQRIFTPGLFVRIRLPIGGPHRAVLVNERAISTNQGEKFVYVVNDKNRVVYKQVQLGQLQNGLREIVDGLAADERVIVNGLLRVRPGIEVNAVEETMTPALGAVGGEKQGVIRK